jgi:hypothetical protein
MFGFIGSATCRVRECDAGLAVMKAHLSTPPIDPGRNVEPGASGSREHVVSYSRRSLWPLTWLAMAMVATTCLDKRTRTIDFYYSQ